jgi:hypothetical protein
MLISILCQKCSERINNLMKVISIIFLFFNGAGELSRYSEGLRAEELHSIQADSGAHPASYSIGRGALSPGLNGRGVKPTTRLHLVQSLRMGE